MTQSTYLVDDDLLPYVNCIMTGENTDESIHTNIPIYADGYPGIMFQQATNDFYLLPKKKQLSQLFLYGQTIEPISLDVKGPYRSIVVQLYPFASKYLLGIDPKILNDDCYDLLQIDYIDIQSFRTQLIHSNNFEEQLGIISALIRQLITAHKVSNNEPVQKAISIILSHNGQIKIKEVREQVFMTERTLERHFLSLVGLSPKQFAKIIQFQSALRSLSQSSYNTLTDVGLDSGFSDQSHFIRTFKKYTGQTPSFYLNSIS